MQKDAYNVAGAVDYIFTTEHAWIVARIQSGEVLAWSVTVTDKRLKVDLRNLTFGLVKGKLGRSRFSDVVEQPSGVIEEVGSVSYAYAERTYFGRPSAYQSFVFMHNLEGVGTFENGGSTSAVGTRPFSPQTARSRLWKALGRLASPRRSTHFRRVAVTTRSLKAEPQCGR
nr:ETEC_3214 domain-containing protein [Arthrobacter sp. efr-133-TYG-120]